MSVRIACKRCGLVGPSFDYKSALSDGPCCGCANSFSGENCTNLRFNIGAINKKGRFASISVEKGLFGYPLPPVLLTDPIIS